MHNIENNKGLGGSLPFMKNLGFWFFTTIQNGSSSSSTKKQRNPRYSFGPVLEKYNSGFHSDSGDPTWFWLQFQVTQSEIGPLNLRNQLWVFKITLGGFHSLFIRWFSSDWFSLKCELKGQVSIGCNSVLEHYRNMECTLLISKVCNALF